MERKEQTKNALLKTLKAKVRKSLGACAMQIRSVARCACLMFSIVLPYRLLFFPPSAPPPHLFFRLFLAFPRLFLCLHLSVTQTCTCALQRSTVLLRARRGECPRTHTNTHFHIVLYPFSSLPAAGDVGSCKISHLICLSIVVTPKAFFRFLSLYCFHFLSVRNEQLRTQ